MINTRVLFDATLFNDTFNSQNGIIKRIFEDRMASKVRKWMGMTVGLFVFSVIFSALIFYLLEEPLFIKLILTLIILIVFPAMGLTIMAQHIKMYTDKIKEVDQDKNWHSILEQCHWTAFHSMENMYWDNEYRRSWEDLISQINLTRKFYYNPVTKDIFIPIQNVKEDGNINIIECESVPEGYYSLIELEGRVDRDVIRSINRLREMNVPTFDEAVAILKSESAIRVSNIRKESIGGYNQEVIDHNQGIGLKTINQLRKQSNKLGNILSEIKEEELPYFYKENKELMARLIEESK